MAEVEGLYCDEDDDLGGIGFKLTPLSIREEMARIFAIFSSRLNIVLFNLPILKGTSPPPPSDFLFIVDPVGNELVKVKSRSNLR